MSVVISFVGSLTFCFFYWNGGKECRIFKVKSTYTNSVKKRYKELKVGKSTSPWKTGQNTRIGEVVVRKDYYRVWRIMRVSVILHVHAARLPPSLFSPPHQAWELPERITGPLVPAWGRAFGVQDQRQDSQIIGSNLQHAHVLCHSLLQKCICNNESFNACTERGWVGTQREITLPGLRSLVELKRQQKKAVHVLKRTPSEDWKQKEKRNMWK